MPERLYEPRVWDGLDEALNTLEDGVAEAHEAAAFAQMTANAALGLNVREGESVSNALAEAASNGGGAVRLAAGVHKVDTELFLGDNVSLLGEGASTVLEATSPLHAVVNTGSSAGSSVRHLRMDCNGKADYGLFSSPVERDYGWAEPDPCFRASDLFIDDARIAGVYLGAQARSTRLEEVRVRRAGGWGFWLRNADSWIVDCEATTTGAFIEGKHDGVTLGMTSGFYVGCANSVLRGCKAWYTRGYGWHIKGTRNRFESCESQDTKSHGWRVEWDRNVFTNCVADTSSMYDVGGTVKGADGWYIDGGKESVFVGLLAFDRRPSGKAPQQRYGFNVPKSVVDAGKFVGYNGWDNATALLYAR